MNHNWDTPPDGDFVRYLERLTPPGPGVVMRGKAAPAVPVVAVPSHAAPARPTRPAGQQDGFPPARPPGPPDLSTIFRQLFSQVADEMKKSSAQKRR